MANILFFVILVAAAVVVTVVVVCSCSSCSSVAVVIVVVVLVVGKRVTFFATYASTVRPKFSFSNLAGPWCRVANCSLCRTIICVLKRFWLERN